MKSVGDQNSSCTDLGVECRRPETGPVIKLTCTFNIKKKKN